MLCYFEKGVGYRAPTSSEFTVLLCLLKHILSFICIVRTCTGVLVAQVETFKTITNESF